MTDALTAECTIYSEEESAELRFLNILFLFSLFTNSVKN